MNAGGLPDGDEDAEANADDDWGPNEVAEDETSLPPSSELQSITHDSDPVDSCLYT